MVNWAKPTETWLVVSLAALLGCSPSSFDDLTAANAAADDADAGRGGPEDSDRRSDEEGSDDADDAGVPNGNAADEDGGTDEDGPGSHGDGDTDTDEDSRTGEDGTGLADGGTPVTPGSSVPPGMEMPMDGGVEPMVPTAGSAPPPPPCGPDEYRTNDDGCLPASSGTHLHANLYGFWDFGDNGFWNIDQELKIEQKARSSFWAQNWQWTGRSDGGYMGLQTDGVRFDGTQGELAIFSVWNALDAKDGECAAFGSEGAGWSCRVPYGIVEGRWYRLRIWRVSTVPEGHWWGAWVEDTTTGVDTRIGQILVPDSAATVDEPWNFSEFFGRQQACDAVPVSRAIWTQPAANSNGEGLYDHLSRATTSSRGRCTGGSVTKIDVPERVTAGIRIEQGGPF